jgi:mannosyltransferase OCH1-like enzyme
MPCRRRGGLRLLLAVAAVVGTLCLLSVFNTLPQLETAPSQLQARRSDAVSAGLRNTKQGQQLWQPHLQQQQQQHPQQQEQDKPEGAVVPQNVEAPLPAASVAAAPRSGSGSGGSVLQGTRIPRILHQTWRTRDLPDNCRDFPATWAAQTPDLECV